jgi:hypothetical protein
MADPKVMAQVVASVLDSDGFTALYNAGELHEVGSLPEGVAYRLVVADDAVVASANPHAQQPKKAEAKPAAVKAETKSGGKA